MSSPRPAAVSVPPAADEDSSTFRTHSDSRLKDAAQTTMGGTDVQLQVKGQQWVEDDLLTPAELAGSEMPLHFSSVGPSLVMIPSNRNELLGMEALKERTAKEDNNQDEESVLKLGTQAI